MNKDQSVFIKYLNNRALKVLFNKHNKQLQSTNKI